MIFADGSKYLGSWEAGLPHGHGTFSAGENTASTAFGRSWEALSTYTGDWEKGKPHGTGTMRYADDNMYQGKWASGLRQGKGKLTLSGDSFFTGTWQADSIYGEGIFMSRFREETKGIWKGRTQHIKLMDNYGLPLKEGKFENGLFVGL
jgi:hypothetical protein